MNLRQSSFSCKQAKLLPEIKECSGEKRVSQNLEQEGTLVYLMIDKGAVLLFFFPPYHKVYDIPVPQPGMEPMHPAVEAQSPWDCQGIPKTATVNQNKLIY